MQVADTVGAETENQRMKTHIKLKQYDEAEKIGADPRLANSLQTIAPLPVNYLFHFPPFFFKTFSGNGKDGF